MGEFKYKIFYLTYHFIPHPDTVKLVEGRVLEDQASESGR